MRYIVSLFMLISSHAFAESFTVVGKAQAEGRETYRDLPSSIDQGAIDRAMDSAKGIAMGNCERTKGAITEKCRITRAYVSQVDMHRASSGIQCHNMRPVLWVEAIAEGQTE
ncbi:MAG: hypothetical protein AB7O96_08960 [Pseudobdellovibrionaceae bacterium]